MSTPIGLEHFLEEEACYEFKDSFLRAYGRMSPYIFRTPNPLTARQLLAAGDIGARDVISRAPGSSIHAIGVANRGIPLATAIVMNLGLKGVESYLSVIGRSGSTEHVSTRKYDFTLLVDNAIVTGHTIERALARLASARIPVNLITRLYDREELDRNGRDVAKELAEGFGVDHASIFAFRDVIAGVSTAAERTQLVGYAKQFGTPELKLLIAS